MTTVATLDLNDIQGNLLRGVRAGLARHFLLSIGDPAAASACLASLVPGADDDGLCVSTAAEWKERPSYFLNVGLTFAGLKALQVPDGVLQAFPVAFRRGPAYRGPDPSDPVEPTPTIDVPAMLGDADPATWDFGGPTTGAVHVVVSLYTDYNDRSKHAHRDGLSRRFEELFARHGLTVVDTEDAQALDGGVVHFGYADGIAQPHIAGAPGRQWQDMQPDALPGEFLLGCDYTNQYGGNFLGALPNGLGDNGTFGAFRKAAQDVYAFECFLHDAGKRANMDPELIAAKLMGRWRNGKPLMLCPDAPDDSDGPVSKDVLNAFDYAPTKTHLSHYDDADGLRCPVGAHARRMNPRGSLVMGKPHARRIIRRGTPYGPAIDLETFDPCVRDDGVPRGLVGYFLCGDLESQLEFLLATWANRDFSTSGIRGTRDPIMGAQPAGGGMLTIRTEDGRDPIVLSGIPRWTTTKGAVYCFLPGIGGLRWLGRRAWEADVAGPLN